MVLLINACARRESRTLRLASYLTKKLEAPVRELRLYDLEFPKTDEAFLAFRDSCIGKGDYSDPVFEPARAFAEADTVVVAAPYWDLSFPAVLKQFFEQVTVLGLTFSYDERGVVHGLCKAKKLYYVMTAGGQVYKADYGFGYVNALAQGFYGIPDTLLIKAEGLDVDGINTESVLTSAERAIDRLFAQTEEE